MRGLRRRLLGLAWLRCHVLLLDLLLNLAGLRVEVHLKSGVAVLIVQLGLGDLGSMDWSLLNYVVRIVDREA